MLHWYCDLWVLELKSSGICNTSVTTSTTWFQAACSIPPHVHSRVSHNWNLKHTLSADSAIFKKGTPFSTKQGVGVRQLITTKLTLNCNVQALKSFLCSCNAAKECKWTRYISTYVKKSGSNSSSILLKSNDLLYCSGSISILKYQIYIIVVTT